MLSTTTNNNKLNIARILKCSCDPSNLLLLSYPQNNYHSDISFVWLWTLYKAKSNNKNHIFISLFWNIIDIPVYISFPTYKDNHVIIFSFFYRTLGWLSFSGSYKHFTMNILMQILVTFLLRILGSLISK